MDCRPPSSSDNGILQARILEWVAISSSRGSSWPRAWTRICCIGRWILYYWATWEDPTWMFTALFIRTKRVETTQVPINWWRIQKMYSSRTMKYGSAIKSSEGHAKTWMNLENMMLSERSQIKGHILYGPISVKCPKWANSKGWKVDSWFPGAGGGERWEVTA